MHTALNNPDSAVQAPVGTEALGDSYFYPLGPTAHKALDIRWQELTGSQTQAPAVATELQVMFGRRVQACAHSLFLALDDAAKPCDIQCTVKVYYEASSPALAKSCREKMCHTVHCEASSQALAE